MDYWLKNIHCLQYKRSTRIAFRVQIYEQKYNVMQKKNGIKSKHILFRFITIYIGFYGRSEDISSIFDLISFLISSICSLVKRVFFFIASLNALYFTLGKLLTTL